MNKVDKQPLDQLKFSVDTDFPWGFMDFMDHKAESCKQFKRELLMLLGDYSPALPLFTGQCKGAVKNIVKVIPLKNTNLSSSLEANSRSAL